MEFVKGMRKVKGEWLWEDEREEKRTSGKKKCWRKKKTLEVRWLTRLRAHVLYSDIRHWIVLYRRGKQQQYNRSQKQHRMFGISYLHIAFVHRNAENTIQYDCWRQWQAFITESQFVGTKQKKENRTKNIVIDVSECGTCHPNVALRSLFHWNENFDALSVLRIAKSFSHTTNRNNSELPNNNKNNNNDYIWSLWAHRFAHFAWNVQMNCIFSPLATNSNHTIPDRICALELTMCFRLLLFKCLNWL